VAPDPSDPTSAPGSGPRPEPVPFGVYVHIPFCADRCDYCDFATWTDRGHLVDEYVEACVADLRRQTDGRRAATAFFGGGTPSLIPARGLARIVDAIERDEGAEVTVECNPDSVSPELLAVYAAAGVNRLSFGVQSMQPHVLRELGRTHDPASVGRAVAWARGAGFEHLNLDLIYGTPGESLDDWRRTLDGALALAPDHVSAYALTVEPGTPLGREVARGGRRAPDDDDQAEKYEVADEALHAAGFDWYEISNWARPGGACRHNLLYWAQGDYRAIGAAAHGHRAGRRWWNLRTPERYIAAIRSGASPEAGEERLDEATRAEEALLLAIRTRGGAELTPELGDVAADLVGDGLIESDPERLILTLRGRLLASAVTVRLLAALAAGRPPRAREVAVGRLDC
jgi:putative oxygen-independent coproporphyrinogen III oxidase